MLDLIVTGCLVIWLLGLTLALLRLCDLVDETRDTTDAHTRSLKSVARTLAMDARRRGVPPIFPRPTTEPEPEVVSPEVMSPEEVRGFHRWLKRDPRLP